MLQPGVAGTTPEKEPACMPVMGRPRPPSVAPAENAALHARAASVTPRAGRMSGLAGPGWGAPSDFVLIGNHLVKPSFVGVGVSRGRRARHALLRKLTLPGIETGALIALPWPCVHGPRVGQRAVRKSPR